MSDDEELALVCGRIDKDDPIEGSVQARCSVCGVGVWVSPTGQAFMHLATLYCTTCGMERMRVHEGELRFGIPIGALDEFDRHNKRRKT